MDGARVEAVAERAALRRSGSANGQNAGGSFRQAGGGGWSRLRSRDESGLNPNGFWVSIEACNDKPENGGELMTAESSGEGTTEADRSFRFYAQKTAGFVARGFREGHASGLAQMEMRIAAWPSSWGDDLVVLIYGDFDAPPAELVLKQANHPSVL
jgi:hypothetical protein